MASCSSVEVEMRIAMILIGSLLAGPAHAFDLPMPAMPVIDWEAARLQAEAAGAVVGGATASATEQAGGWYHGASGVVSSWGSQAKDGAVWAWDGSKGYAVGGWGHVTTSEYVLNARALAGMGWNAYVSNPDYWHDLAISAAVAGIAGGGANISCAVAASSVAPVVMTAIGGACGAVGARAASDSLPMVYGYLGWDLDPEAHAQGARMGSMVGVATASFGMGSFGSATIVEGVKVAWPSIKAGMVTDDLIDRIYVPWVRPPTAAVAGASIPDVEVDGF